MAYSTLEDIKARMARFTISATTKPTAAQATSFIDEIDAEINVLLEKAGVTTPVTEPAAFLTWLGNVSANGATATVLKSMFPDAEGPGETPAYAFYEKRYQDALKEIKAGDIIPTSIIVLVDGTDTSEPTTYFTRNPSEEEILDGISEPYFRVARPF